MLDHNLSKIDLSVIEQEINVGKKIRIANMLVQAIIILLIGSVITTIYLQLVLFHIV